MKKYFFFSNIIEINVKPPTGFKFNWPCFVLHIIAKLRSNNNYIIFWLWETHKSYNSTDKRQAEIVSWTTVLFIDLEVLVLNSLSEIKIKYHFLDKTRKLNLPNIYISRKTYFFPLIQIFKFLMNYLFCNVSFFYFFKLIFLGLIFSQFRFWSFFYIYVFLFPYFLFYLFFVSSSWRKFQLWHRDK